ncbi:hypothetical protein ES703_96640 [subsurface metagenome]
MPAVLFRLFYFLSLLPCFFRRRLRNAAKPQHGSKRGVDGNTFFGGTSFFLFAAWIFFFLFPLFNCIPIFLTVRTIFNSIFDNYCSTTSPASIHSIFFHLSFLKLIRTVISCENHAFDPSFLPVSSSFKFDDCPHKIYLLFFSSVSKGLSFDCSKKASVLYGTVCVQ